MSRIGRLPIAIPAGVDVKLNGQQVEVTRRQVGGVDRYLIRANAAVVGYLSEANAATIAAIRRSGGVVLSR